jgi:dTDP-4-dehydrorhamnose 3,5-epimerase
MVMKFTATTLPDVILIEADVYGDQRGFFMEVYQAQCFKEAGIRVDFVQDNHSGSSQKILRGMHYQIRQAQGKLVRVVVGQVFDVAVDLRRRSPTFGKWVGHHLSAENKLQLWIPPGFAHGFYVVSDWAEVLYKATDYYAPEWDRTLLWNDPTVGIDWPLINGEPPIMSQKDMAGLPLSQSEVYE